LLWHVLASDSRVIRSGATKRKGFTPLRINVEFENVTSESNGAPQLHYKNLEGLLITEDDIEHVYEG